VGGERGRATQLWLVSLYHIERKSILGKAGKIKGTTGGLKKRGGEYGRELDDSGR